MTQTQFPAIDSAIQNEIEAARALAADHREQHAILQLEAIVERLNTQYPNGHEEIPGLYVDMAGYHRGLGHYRQAIQSYLGAIEAVKRYCPEGGNEDLASLHYAVACLHSSLKREKRGLPHFESSLDHASKCFGADHPNTQQIRRKYEEAKAAISES